MQPFAFERHTDSECVLFYFEFVKLSAGPVDMADTDMATSDAGKIKAAVEKERFYLRYYVGHRGKFGHEFLEFDFRPDGKLRYANNSNYKNDTLIRKECVVSKAVLNELKRIVVESDILLVSAAGGVRTPGAGGRQPVARAGPRGSAGAGDPGGRRARLLHHLQDRLADRRAGLGRRGRPPLLLLLGAGLEVSGLLAHGPALQDQAHLTYSCDLLSHLIIRFASGSTYHKRFLIVDFIHDCFITQLIIIYFLAHMRSSVGEAFRQSSTAAGEEAADSDEDAGD